MCSTPKPRQKPVKKSLDSSLSIQMGQSAYSKMIKQANLAYESRYPESTDSIENTEPARQKLVTKTKHWSYWLTRASLTEISRRLLMQINFH